MRVIAGEFRSRRLKSLPGLDTRPTPDRLREALFNVLAPIIEDSLFIDAYAGTGAVGIEALSRGARKVFFVEKSRSAVDVIRDNLASLGLQSRAEVFTGKAADVLQRIKADIVFLDPPYEKAAEYDVAITAAAEAGSALVIAQHESRVELKEQFGALRKYRVLRHGSNAASFFHTTIEE